MIGRKSIGLTALCASLALLASTLGTTASAQERELRIVSWGGSFQAAQRKVYFEPFTKETGIKIKEDEWAQSNMAVVEAMVKSGKITWDIIDQGGMDIIAACDAGIVEPLDIEALGGKDRFLPGAVYECGIHTTIAAEIPAYNSDKFPGEKPDSLADFYDVAKFPGKRGMRKVAWANLEVALIADGVAPADMVDLSTPPNPNATPPEWAWWEFDINDVTDGEGDVMKGITDAVDPDLTRFLVQQDGKLILYHGWADALVVPQPTVTYYDDMVDTTFGGDLAVAQERARLFMAPGMGHCRGGRGPDTWDRLAPLVAWVERGEAPDALIATHATDGTVDNERPLCPYPARAVYTGPAGGADDPANWTAANFTCR